MIRRFVNLVVANHDRCVYSLHRLDVAKHLFYPSTAEAEAANAKEEEEEEDSHNGAAACGDEPRRPSRIERLRRLPKPMVRFQQFPPAYQCVHHHYVDDDFDDDDDESPPDKMFVLLSPRGGRIFHATEAGHAVLYDAGDDDDHSAGSITTLPSLLDGPNGRRPIAIPIATAAADDDDDDGRRRHGRAEKESLYVMSSHHGGPSHSFQVLHVSQHPPKWDPLPPPPFADNESVPSITSFTVVDDDDDGDGTGSTICVSTENNRTYCFDTRSHRWWHAGDWRLPFVGRAEYVPELDAWLGLRFPWYGDFSDHLCASSDLGAAVHDHHREPTLQHVWEDLVPPIAEQEFVRLSRRFNEMLIKRRKEWQPLRSRGGQLINLGGGRFSVAKFVQVKQVVEDITKIEAEFVVLTGVEVLRDGEGVEELRMVKHRSRRYMFANDVIQWVL